MEQVYSQLQHLERAQSCKAALDFGTGNRTTWCLSTRDAARIWAGIKIYHSVLPFLAYRARMKAGSKKGHGYLGTSQDSLR